MSTITPLTVRSRIQWRSWLQKNHAKAKEAWLVYYKKASGKKGIVYEEALQEALCFGWIDTTARGIDEEKYMQRWTPRRKRSNWSVPNLERVKRLEKQGLMTKAGRAALPEKVESGPVKVAPDIRKALKGAKAWENYEKFPEIYRRVRIAWIEAARKRPEVFETRLRHFVKMTAKGKRYGLLGS